MTLVRERCCCSFYFGQGYKPIIRSMPQKGLKFDGINDLVIAPTTGLPVGTDELSISIKFKKSRNNLFEGLIGYGGNIAFSIISIGIIDNKFAVFYGSGSGITTNEIFENGDYTVTITKANNATADSVKIYVNGELKPTTLEFGTNGLIDIGTVFNVVIGRWLQVNAFYFLGIMNDIKIWNKELSDTEVVDNYLYNNITSGLIRLYEFDDKEGFILTDKANGYNGTIINKAISDVTVSATNDWLYEDGSPYDGKKDNEAKLSI